ncbi:MAG: AmmeMemoRadiSam system radical SAM enzyme [Clostridiales bacterium]|nr:AmmeMemoRadiSam system radical SAM enzyme [Clostridiales bacterium]
MSDESKGTVTCQVCFRHCRLREGQIGFCRARRNEGGASVCINYGKITSMAFDPIEKKPLARFCPGTYILSVGSFGCNLDCPFCQNHQISCADEQSVQWEYYPPDLLASLAESQRKYRNIGVAYTYNEPLVGWEYVRDTAAEVRRRGMKNVVVTNGSITLPHLEQILPYIDAFNIDLKGFTREWYKKLGGDLDIVLDFIRTAAKCSHVELTTLIVPGGNDSPDEMRELSEWVASVDRKIPLHITRFFPRRKMAGSTPTDISLLYRLVAVAKEYLETVIVGNV